MVEKLITHLEMTAPEQLLPAAAVKGLELVRLLDPAGRDAQRIRRLHDAIATPHRWSSLRRPDEPWQPETGAGRSHWVAVVAGADVGWASLAASDNRGVQIAAFGILPDRLGRGYGGAFLTALVDEAWRQAARADVPRVWLRTSSWDHPHALANYRARGFTVTRLELRQQRAGTDSHQSTPVPRPPRFIVRPAVTDDAAAVTTLIADLGYQSSIETARRRLGRLASSPDDVVAVAVEHPDRIVGMISAHVIPLFAEDEPALVRITALSVSPSVVRNGIGRRLVEFVEYSGWERGVRLLEVSSGRRQEREAAHRFYEALGFHDSAASSIRYWKHLQ